MEQVPDAEDQRQRRLRLTASGKRLWKRLPDPLGLILSVAFDGLEETELATARRVLQTATERLNHSGSTPLEGRCCAMRRRLGHDMRHTFSGLHATLALGLVLSCVGVAGAQESVPASGPVPVAIVGLAHGHVQGFLGGLSQHPEVKLVGISDPVAALRDKYEQKYHLPHAMFFASEKAMLEATHPAAILVYTSPEGHLPAIEVAAPMHVAAMVEKPLATTVPDALKIQQLSETNHVPVLTNYETTWYASNAAAGQMLADGKIGEIRRMVFHDGHRGPKEIGVDPEFLSILESPEQNGAGALFDFGCYGADLATVMMHGELPTEVVAVLNHDKPAVYPKVDDDATVLLKYPKAVADIEGSWNWPFDRKDMELYGSTGYVDTVYVSTQITDHLRERLPGEATEHLETAPALQGPRANSMAYLVAVLRGQLNPDDDLTSLPTNVKVVRILDAARRSAATGQAIRLAGTER